MQIIFEMSFLGKLIKRESSLTKITKKKCQDNFGMGTNKRGIKRNIAPNCSLLSAVIDITAFYLCKHSSKSYYQQVHLCQRTINNVLKNLIVHAQGESFIDKMFI